VRRSLLAALALVLAACTTDADRAGALEEAGAVSTEDARAGSDERRARAAGPKDAAAGGPAGGQPGSLPPMEVTGTATDTIDLRSEGPTLQFLPDRLAATSGERVLLRYRNGGDLPHNFALFRRDEVVDRMATAAYEAESTGFIPASAAGELIAYSLLVSPGETVEMEFVVPPPGRYTYICLFPGHAQMMLGTLTAR